MADSNSTQGRIINGFYPATVTDIECFAAVVLEQAKAMSALFRTIARLTDDKEVNELCSHGALQADLQVNDIDCMREQVMKAGFNMEAV
jgi:hypothetical protein